MAMLETFREALPVFETVTPCAALDVPVVCWPNERLGVDRPTMGAAGGGELPLPPPPPQATQTPTTRSAVANSQLAERRRAVAKLTSVAGASTPTNSQNHARERPKLGGAFRCRVGSVALGAAAVVTVSVAVAPEEAVRFTDDGENAQLMLVSETPQLRVTVPAKPATGVKVTVEVPDWPGAGIVMLVGLDETLKSETFIVTAGDVVELK